MPGTIRVRILGARDLPIMDKSAETTDAFVEVRFGNTSYKTDVCPKTLFPRWDSEYFVFEAEDQELQDECLQLRVMDYDTYSANDAVGRIYLDLNPLIEAANRLGRSRRRSKLSEGDPLSAPIEPYSAELLNSSVSSAKPIWSQAAEMKGWLPILDTLTGRT